MIRGSGFQRTEDDTFYQGHKKVSLGLQAMVYAYLFRAPHPKNIRQRNEILHWQIMGVTMKSLDVFMLSENSKWAIPVTEALTKTSYLGL